jgi:4-diphosphocytidyl-2-C-methyl-D-erythritol kinase
MPATVEILAPAKVNLRLKVLAQLTSGYHSLESVFCALSLCDRLRVTRGGGDVRLLVQGDVDVGPPGENLVVRAARRFYLEIGGVEDGVTIELTKEIPSAAGLGGGSSDAAATLRALNALHDEPLSAERLLQLGSELGSDVPFFLCGSPLALGWGRGERLLALPPLPERAVLVAHPGVPMPTGQAFQRIAELRGGGYEPPAFSLSAADLTSWAAIAVVAENDFEEPAFERIPQLAAARSAMLEAGAEIALLAGSGASLFGIFPDGAAPTDCETAVRALGFRVWSASTLRTLPEPSPSRHSDSPLDVEGLDLDVTTDEIAAFIREERREH